MFQKIKFHATNAFNWTRTQVVEYPGLALAIIIVLLLITVL